MGAARARERRARRCALASAVGMWLCGAGAVARAEGETVRVAHLESETVRVAHLESETVRVAHLESETVRVAHEACAGAPPLVAGHDVIAQLRVELVGTPLSVASDAGARPPSGPARALTLTLCGTLARITRTWPSGATDSRELDVSVYPAEARVRIVALVLAELARADLRDPGQPAAEPSAPPAPRDSAFATTLTAPTRPPSEAERARFARPRALSQDLTFTVRAFTTPAAPAFGPRLALDVGRWEVGLESATASSQRGSTQVLMNLAAASLGYQVLRYGDEVRVDIAPSAELGVTWYRTSASADGGGVSSGAPRPPDTGAQRVWASGTVRAGVTVAVTPPIYARFVIFAGYALGLRAQVNDRTELTSRGAFGGLGLGVGWER